MDGVVKEDDEMSFAYSGIPEEEAWFLSRLFFAWERPLFQRGSKLFKRGEALQQDDLLPLPRRDYGARISPRFEKAWNEQQQQQQQQQQSQKKRSLSDEKDIKAGGKKIVKAINNVMGRKFVWAGIIKAINTALQFGFPILLSEILKFIEQYDSEGGQDRYRGYWLSALLFFAMGCKAVTENAYFHIVNRCAFQAKAAISVAVYNKSLRLSNAERQLTTLGELVNLMQVDASKIEAFIPNFHVLWDGLFQIAGYMAILYTLIGPSCFAGLFVMVCAAPVQGQIMKKLFGHTRQMVKHTDARVEATNEALQGMQGVKMYTWEDNVAAKIESFRSEEMKHLTKQALLRGFSRAYMYAMPGIVAVVSFVSYSVFEKGEITASRLFAAILAFDQLRFPLMFYPMSLALYVQAKVSAARLEIYLEMGEICGDGTSSHQVGTYKRENDSEGGIIMKNAEVYWNDPSIPLASKADDSSEADSTAESDSLGGESKESKSISDAEMGGEPELIYQKAALKNMNLTVKNGELCAVVGRVASGKSTLCSAVLNETFLNKGEITLKGQVAYAAQSPWILNATLRENILFGQPMDEERYAKVLKACQLEHDLKLLEDGDLTDIGEKGINLSGGQKARVSVARAAYSDANTIILDDPLSALDPEVAAALFHECIVDFMAGKTRLLVTNQLQFLSACEHLVVLKKGEIFEDGTSTELLAKRDSEVNRLMTKLSRKSTANVLKATDGSEKESEKDKVGIPALAEKKKNKLMTKEERNIGAVSLSVYLKYLKAGGGYLSFAFLYSGYILTSLISTATVAWVSYWTTDGEYQRHDKAFYLGIYLMLSIALGVFTFFRSYRLAMFVVKAAEVLHNDLLRSILRAPMSFFDTTPLGRIVSRFSKDIYSVDLELGEAIEFVLFCTLTVFISILSIVVVTPWFGIVVLPLAFIYFQYLQYFRSVSRETKRLDSISRSPVYSQFSETLGGLSTIRAYGQPTRFRDDFEGKVNDNTKALYNNKVADRWLSTRLETLGAAIAGLAAVFAVQVAVSDSGSGISDGNANLSSYAGVSLTYAISVTGLLQWTVRSFSNMENYMNATERLLFYTEETPKEASWTSKELEKAPYDDSKANNASAVAMASASGKAAEMSAEWPETGAIEIKNLQMRYRSDTPLVLKGLNVSIAGGERIGVVGRTGSGKSSLLLSLLRLVEPDMTGGKEYESPITIDGVDILRIGLRELRSKIGIISQNPLLFSGTVKFNLDPFNEFTDELIWKALSDCGLKESVEEMPGQLDAPIAEYGENLSSGMRQMLVLGRALLRNCKILFLDEATASVDIETDREIQRTLREAFKDCTVLTIAHRINTIMDSDKILVLKDGRAEEFAPPEELLQNEKSLFAEIVRHSEGDADDK